MTFLALLDGTRSSVCRVDSSTNCFGHLLDPSINWTNEFSILLIEWRAILDVNFCFRWLSEICHLSILSVWKYKRGDPYLINLFRCQGIEIRIWFQMVILKPWINPFYSYFQLYCHQWLNFINIQNVDNFDWNEQGRFAFKTCKKG